MDEEEKVERIPTFNTTCEYCIFNNQQNEHENVDCELGRYEKFKERGEINEQGIITRLCSCCRDLEWKNQKDENPVERIINDMQSVYGLIIFEPDNGVLLRLPETLKSKQSIDPKQIILVYKDDTPIGEVTSILNSYTKDSNTKFLVVKTVKDKTDRELIDWAVDRCNCMFYTLVRNGERLVGDEFEKLYREIDENLNRVVYVHPYSESLTGMTVLRKFHTFVNGNVTEKIEDKLMVAVEQENTHHCVYKWGDLT